MRLPHSHALFVHGHGPAHRLSASVKLVALLVFVLAVAATPREAGWILGGEAVLVVAIVAFARLSPRLVASRLLIEVPFIAFALMLPFVGGGPRVVIGPLELSQEGLWAAWGVLAKSTLCLAAAITVTATTTIPDLLLGLQRLRVPRVFVSIAGFMVRYLDVLIGEARRMRVAMAARGYRPRLPNDARPMINGAAALFVRSHERGERVYAAMLARGYREVTP